MSRAFFCMMEESALQFFVPFVELMQMFCIKFVCFRHFSENCGLRERWFYFAVLLW